LSRSVKFGIVGGYGATGRIVVSELAKSCDGEILIGGRDLAKAKAVAAEFGTRVSAAQLDVLHARSLDDFCSRCAIIVNTAGPVMILQDCVAQAAFRSHCHYADAAGMAVVKERMLPHAPEIAALGLSFVVSAGWTPGLTELLPVYAYSQARCRMESIDSVTAYFSDSGNWSENALRDGVAFIRQAGLAKAGYFRKGEWVRAKMSEVSCKADLGDPIGRRRFSLYTMPELSEVGRQLPDCDFLSYSHLSGFRNAAAFMLIALLPLWEQTSIPLLRNMFRRNRLPVGGFVVVHVVGRSAGRRVVLKARITFDLSCDYWMNGVAIATTARMISQGKDVKAGVNFLASAVDPVVFIAALQESGVGLTESFDATGTT